VLCWGFWAQLLDWSCVFPKKLSHTGQPNLKIWVTVTKFLESGHGPVCIPQSPQQSSLVYKPKPLGFVA